MKKLALLACLVTLPAFAEIPLEVVRVTTPADLHSGEQTRPLQVHDMVDESDRVLTGSGGRVTLKFAEASTMTLGERAELYIHSADPPDVGQGSVIRLQLERGDLDVDAHGEGSLPQDFRINIGALSARTVGGHVWATADSKGETLCLISGSAEINLGESHYRLDTANDCLGHRSDSNEVQKVSSAQPAIDALLARTNFDAEPGAAAKALPTHWAMTGSGTPVAAAKPTSVAKPVASKPAATAAQSTPAPTAATGEWVVVVASLEPAAAEQMKNKLAHEGLHAALQPSAANPALQQVIIGDYKSANEARKHVDALKKRFKGAWVTQRHEN